LTDPEHDYFEPELPRQLDPQPAHGWRSLADVMAEADEAKWDALPISAATLGRPDRMLVALRGESEAHKVKRTKQTRQRRSPTSG
jgi:hypothetical protein